MTEQPQNTSRNLPPEGEKRGALTDALMQTAHDVKEVGIGIYSAYAYDKLKGPKDPPKDK